MAPQDKKTESLHCNDCGRDTDHSIVQSHRNKEFCEPIKDDYGKPYASIDGFYDWQLLECQGCKTVHLRSKQYCSEWVNPFDQDIFHTEYYPPRNTGSRVKPHWFDRFAAIGDLQGHFILTSYKQIYSLIESGQSLAAMLTCRALLETIAIEHSSDEFKTFYKKLESL